MARNRDRFPRATGMSKGYRREQVDGWLNRVETAMRLADGIPTVSSAEVRRVGFDLVRRGYDVGAVDAHLDRLEELAVAAEAEGETSTGRLAGADGATSDAGRLARDLQAPDGERFAHAPLLTRGYDPRDVDAFVDEVLLPGLTGAAPLPAVDQVRSVVFRGRRGGYDEAAVDDALDAVVDHLLRRDRVGAAFVPAHVGARPGPALERRPEPAPTDLTAPPSAAAPLATPAADPDDAWAVDGWLPEPHRGRAVPGAPASPVPAGAAGDEAGAGRDGTPRDVRDPRDVEATVVWMDGLPTQGAAERSTSRREPDVDAPEPVAHEHDADPGQARRRSSTGTGWPG